MVFSKEHFWIPRWIRRHEINQSGMLWRRAYIQWQWQVPFYPMLWPDNCAYSRGVKHVNRRAGGYTLCSGFRSVRVEKTLGILCQEIVQKMFKLSILFSSYRDWALFPFFREAFIFKSQRNITFLLRLPMDDYVHVAKKNNINHWFSENTFCYNLFSIHKKFDL